MDKFVRAFELLYGIKKSGIEVCLVSKYWSKSEFMKFYNVGYRIFGESRVDALIKKAQNYPKDIEWHFIGNLQSRDIGKICKYAKMIQSFDRPDLLSKLATYPNIDILIQINISESENRNGIFVKDLGKVILEIENQEISCKGFMVHPPMDSSIDKKKYWFEEIQKIFEKHPKYTVLSMGTSNDFELANEFGATLNRLGRILLNEI